MICEDFTCIGRTVPEESRKYGHRVCMAGYSRELNQLMRVYPLPVRNPIHARQGYVLELMRNESDSRPESWKLRTHDIREAEGVTLDVAHLEGLCVESIDDLNARRRSLGVLRVDGVQGEFAGRADVPKSDQPLLFDLDEAAARFGAKALDVVPYLNFFDSAGRPHRLQIREWGCFEWVRKNPENAAQLWRNLKLDKPQLLVVGNMNNHRTAWLVIKSFPVSSEQQPTLFETGPEVVEA